MSECLGPLLSFHSSPLVIYSSPLVICSCCLLDALRTCLFKYFINNFFLFTFCHNIFIRTQSALPGYISTLFCCKCLRTCYTHNSMGILCNLCDIILLNVFLILFVIKILHKLIINFKNFFIIDIFLFWTSHFHVFPPKSSFFISFVMIYSSFSTTMSSL